MRSAASRLLLGGARAAEDLASELLGFSVRKAIDPLSPAGFLLIGEQVSDALAKAAEDAEEAVLADVLATLDLEWATLSDAAITAAMKAVQEALTKSYLKKVLPAVDSVLVKEGPKFMHLVRLATAASESLEIVTSLSQRDLKAEEAIRASQLNFIRDSTGKRVEALSARARDKVASAVEQGLGSDTIAKDLKDEFGDSVPRPESYWRTVADAFVGRARTRSQVGALDDAGITSYEIVAVLDEVTTDICRFMHGQVFEVAATKSFLDSLDSLENPEDVKYAQPWVRKGIDPDGGGLRLYVPRADGTGATIAKIDRSGVGSLDDRGSYSKAKGTADLISLGIPCPPFHGRCRTTIVAAADDD